MEWRNIFTIFFCYLDADYTIYSLARELQKNHNDHTEGLNTASKFLKRIKVPTIKKKKDKIMVSLDVTEAFTP